MVRLTDARLNAILHDLDAIAREHCPYEYGLPVGDLYEDGLMPRMREVLRKHLTPTEAEQIIDLCVKKR